VKAGDPRSGVAHPEPASLLGVEQEYTVRLGREPVDFRWLAPTLPVAGRRVDPGDPLALRCAWGGVITADGAEAEIAIPPVPVRPGFTVAARGLVRTGLEELAGAIPPEMRLEGYSTHVSVAMPDRLNDRVCRLFVRRFAPAMMLLTGRAETPGMLVRPRPSRTELGVEHVDGPLLAAASAFAVGAARACAAAVAGDRAARRALPPALRARTEPAVRRYGTFVGSAAFGGDLYREGREAAMRTRTGRAVTGQQVLEAAWEAARDHLGSDGAASDVTLLDSLVVGRLPLVSEAPLAVDVDPVSASPRPGPFGDALRPYRSGSLYVRPTFITWDFVVFEARCRGRVAYACIPRDGLEGFLGAMHRGRLDPLVEEFVATERTPRILAEHGQTREPGLYDGIGDPTRLLPPERPPAGRGGPTLPGGRHAKDQRRPRPRRAEPPVAAAGQRAPRRGLLIGVAVVALLVIAAIAAIALGGGGSKPEAVASSAPPSATGPTASAVAPPTTPANSSPPASPASPAPPSPTESELSPPTALSGSYNVKVTVKHLSTTVRGVKVGQSRSSSWILSTDCAARPCDLALIGESRTGEKIDATGPFVGRTVSGQASSPLRCVDSSTGATTFEYEETVGTFTVHVSDVQRVVGVPQATSFTGAFHFVWEPPPGQNVPGCPKVDETDGVNGSLRKLPSPQPLQPGEQPPPIAEGAVLGTWDTTLHVTKLVNVPNKKVGDDLQRLYVFVPNCREATGCGLTLIRESADGISRNQLQPAADGTYREIINQTFDCGDGKARFSQKLEVRVKEADVVAGVWRATKMTGVFLSNQTPLPGATGCQKVVENDRITSEAQI